MVPTVGLAESRGSEHLEMPSTPPSAGAVTEKRWRGVLSGLFSESAPLDLRLIGRTLLHAVLSGLVAVLFVGALELVEDLLLGYARLRAHGESVLGHEPERGAVRLWLLPLIPALRARRAEHVHAAAVIPRAVRVARALHNPA
ncbi:Chloride channel protein [Minicystis rosea]|nr:Chloride channel protein [Minicystis rosea]